MDQGTGNNTYLIQQGKERFILKVYPNQPFWREKLSFLQQKLDDFDAQGLAIANMLESPLFHSDNIFVRYRYIEGKSPKKPSARELIQAARWLGCFHAQCAFTHGDFFPDNVIFHSGQLVGVCDFDLLRPDNPYRDLASAAIGWCYSGNRLDWGKLYLFVKNYQRHSFLKRIKIAKILHTIPDCIHEYIQIRQTNQTDTFDLKIKLNSVCR